MKIYFYVNVDDVRRTVEVEQSTEYPVDNQSNVTRWIAVKILKEYPTHCIRIKRPLGEGKFTLIQINSIFERS